MTKQEAKRKMAAIMAAKKFLAKARTASVAEQQIIRAKIIKEFEIFWASGPTCAEFCAYTSGLVLMPEMLYLMVKNG